MFTPQVSLRLQLELRRRAFLKYQAECRVNTPVLTLLGVHMNFTITFMRGDNIQKGTFSE
jgi:hypothetical protein